MLPRHPHARKPVIVQYIEQYIPLPDIPVSFKVLCLNIENKLSSYFHLGRFLSRSIPIFIFTYFICGLYALVIPTIGSDTAFGVGIICFAIVLVILVLSSFIRAAFGDPGQVPEAWKDWNGILDQRPMIPRYAIKSEFYLRQRRERLEEGLRNVNKTQVKIIDHSKGTPNNSGVLLASQASADQIQEQFHSGSLMLMVDEGDELPEGLQSLQWQPLNDCDHSHNNDENDVATTKKTTKDEYSIPIRLHSHNNNNNVSVKDVAPLLKQLPQIPGIKFNMSDIQFPTAIRPIEHQSNNNKSFVKSISNPPKTFDEAPEIKEVEDNDEDAHIKMDPYPTQHCEKCSLYKPPRTHHCSQCKRCVARMDHHCVWLNNCVGYDNHKFFFMFLFYTAIGLTYYICVSVYVFFTYGSPHWFAVLLFFVDIAFLKFVVELFLTQFTFLTRNITQLEQMFQPTESLMAYDKRDKYDNFILVFGQDVLKWFLPIK